MKWKDLTGASGFTLIEVMIVVAVVAILTTVALPSYSSYLVRVNRSAAEQFMLDVVNRQEQFLLDQRAYAAFTCTSTCTGSLGVRPEASVAGNYTFASVTTGNDCVGNAVASPAYVITATAIGKQASDGNLCIDSRNNKSPIAKWDR
jgi:type IV pilus assembly protein PilE